MARYKILLLMNDCSEVAELAVDALLRSDAVAFAERVSENAAVKGCGYELWYGPHKVVRRPSARQRQLPFRKALRRLWSWSNSMLPRAKRSEAHS